MKKNNWNVMGFVFALGCVVMLLLMAGCNFTMGALEGAGKDWRAMTSARKQDVQDGETMKRMRELGWSNDHLLDDPSYGQK